jgi:hypothetical protein
MSKVKMPVDGSGEHKGEPDGVSASPADNDGANVHGRTEGGESGGGAYPNPYTGMKPTSSGFFGHGGQTVNEYHGSPAGGQNAVTGDGYSGSAASAPSPEPDRLAHHVEGEGGSFQVIEASGVAEAERSGKIGTDARYEEEQEAPGSG